MGNLSTPNSVQKLQTALHAKAKTEADYRFYALYDKIYRADILAFAFAQCRSNKGAPGVDGQDFADIEAYGLERWLGSAPSTHIANAPDLFVNDAEACLAHRAGRRSSALVAAGAGAPHSALPPVSRGYLPTLGVLRRRPPSMRTRLGLAGVQER